MSDEVSSALVDDVCCSSDTDEVSVWSGVANLCSAEAANR